MSATLPSMPSDQDSAPSPSSDGHHLATISHEGRFWDVFLEFKDDPGDPSVTRALLCFEPADAAEGERPARTTIIIVEDSYEMAVQKARGFREEQLQALLRSSLG